MARKKRARPSTEREKRDRRGRLAIGWGTAIVLVGFAVGCAVSFVPVATGLRFNPPFGGAPAMDLIVVVGSLSVSFIGLALILYGLVELARSRPEEPHPSP